MTGLFFDPPAPKKYDVDLRDFTLRQGPAAGRTAYDRYVELSGHGVDGLDPLKDALTDLVTSDAYKELPHGRSADDGTKEGLILGVMKQYRDAAWGQLLSESDELQDAVTKHRLDVATAVASGAKSVPAVAGQARMGVVNQLLKPFGLGLPKVNVPSVSEPSSAAQPSNVVPMLPSSSSSSPSPSLKALGM